MSDLDWIAQLDQAKRAAVDVAALMHAYFEELCKSGFTAEQAIVLTAAYQTTLMRNASS